AGCVAAAGASPSSVPGTVTPGPTGRPPVTVPSSSPTTSQPVPSPSSSPSPSPGGCGVTTWARGSNELVLRIAIAGGLLAPGADLANLPVISAFGDGSVITQGPQIMIYPGPALPNLQVQRLSDAGMRRLLDAAAGAG